MCVLFVCQSIHAFGQPLNNIINKEKMQGLFEKNAEFTFSS
jgi:hypothetical protein